MMDAPILHTFTVRGRPAALDARGAVHAVELGYFPVSSTGFYSMYLWRDEHPDLTDELLAAAQKELEKKANERDKEIKSAEKAGLKAIKTKHTDPVYACIDLSGAFDRIAGQALFSDEEDQKDLLQLALRVADKLASMPCPETLDHHVWKVEHVQKQIDKAARQVELIRQCLSDGHMLALAESKDSPIGGTLAYAEIFREQAKKEVNDCGHNRPQCPPDDCHWCPDCPDAGPSTEVTEPGRCVIDRRRPRKAYLVGRDKYFIWRGHYSHNPALSAWGMTEERGDAYRFGSLQEAIDYWRSRHTFPEEYEHCIWDGYLTFWEETKKGIRRVMPEPPQQELF